MDLSLRRQHGPEARQLAKLIEDRTAQTAPGYSVCRSVREPGCDGSGTVADRGNTSCTGSLVILVLGTLASGVARGLGVYRRGIDRRRTAQRRPA